MKGPSPECEMARIRPDSGARVGCVVLKAIQCFAVAALLLAQYEAHVATLCRYRREPNGETVYQFIRVER